MMLSLPKMPQTAFDVAYDPALAAEPVAPPQPFIWGEGGARLTPEEVLARQENARSRMQADFSPVGSAWEGWGRVANNLLGALENRKLDKEAAAGREADAALMESVMGGGRDPVTAALLSPYTSKQTREFAKMRWERDNPKPSAPHYWETNNGSLGMVGPDGQPRILYQDPTPKIDWIQARDPSTGQVTLYPMQQGGGGPASGAVPGASPPASLPSDFFEGGPTQPASGGFR